MNKIFYKQHNKKLRAHRTRTKLKIQHLPRLSVYRSHKYFSAQIIDDVQGRTLVAVSEKEAKGVKGTKIDRAKYLGKLVAQKAVKKGITKVTFDRGPYLFHGRVAEFAEGARNGGLKF